MASFGIGNLKTASGQGIDVIDDCALEVVCAKRINEDGDAMNFAGRIVRAAFVEDHPVLHAGATAGFDVNAEEFVGVIGLIEKGFYLRSSAFGQRNDRLKLNGCVRFHYVKTLRLVRERVNGIGEI